MIDVSNCFGEVLMFLSIVVVVVLNFVVLIGSCVMFGISFFLFVIYWLVVVC